MYGVDQVAVEALWSGLRRHMIEAGLERVPNDLSAPGDLTAHWLAPGLLLSQTCGYPLVTHLAGQVRYVATPRFLAPGCDGAWYSSALVVREGDRARSIADLRGRIAAFNSADSQSGYNALRALIAPFASRGRFFARAVETGSHRGSLHALRTETADIAAIDAVTLAHLAKVAGGECEGLRVMGYTASAPGLPLITSASTTPAELAALRDALARVSLDAALASCRATLGLDGFDVLPDEAYAIIGQMRSAAIDAGYPELA